MATFLAKENWQRVWDRDIANLIDKCCTQNYKLPSNILMEHAGRSVAECALDLAEEQQAWKKLSLSPMFLVVVGRGNNGGDGLVVARWIKHWGGEVHVACSFDPINPGELSPLNRCNLETCLAMGIPVEFFQSQSFLNSIREQKEHPHIIIDALYGIGFRSPMKSDDGNFLQMLASFTDKKVIAVDIPSGLECDAFSQDIPPPLAADLTVSFGAAKPAHLAFPNASFVGSLKIIDIGFVRSAVTDVLDQEKKKHPRGAQIFSMRKDPLLAENRWQQLAVDAHKFDRGHVLVLGGSPGKWGAPLLSGMAALRTGAGWVSVSLFQDEQDYFVPPMYPPEITFEKFFHNKQMLREELATFILSRKVTAVVVGPGMMGGSLTGADIAILAKICREHGVFMVFDAGALHNFVDQLDKDHFDPQHCIATPHPGEWLKLSATKILSLPRTLGDITGLEADLAATGVTFVYKNAAPMILDFTEISPKLKICHGGTNSLAKAGTGDILSGIIASHGAIGYPAAEAFARSYALLCKSAHEQGAIFGWDALLPRDLIAGL